MASAADWSSKPFPNWKEDTVLRLLTDSPWANARTVKLEWRKPEDMPPVTYKDVPGADHSRQIPVGSPVGGIGGKVRETLPDRADVIFRWASALPVRHAKALYQLRDEKLPPGRLNALIGAPDTDYVLEVFGLPVVMAHRGTGSIESIFRQGTTLRTKSGRILRPVKTEAVVSANEMTVRIHFSRANPLTLKDGEIEISGDAQVMGFKERFKLSAMQYQGHLEL